MRFYKISFVAILLCYFQAGAQTLNDVESLVKRSPAGTYFYVTNLNNPVEKLFESYKNFNQFEAQVMMGNNKWQTIKVLSMPQNDSELEERLGTNNFTEYRKAMELKQGVSLLKSLLVLPDLPTALQLDKPLAIALGLAAFYPKDEKNISAYRLMGEPKKGKSEIIYLVKDDGSPAPQLPSARVSDVNVNDSIVNISWTMPMPRQKGNVFAHVFQQIGNKYEMQEEVIWNTNNDDTSLSFNFTKKVAPDELHHFYIITENVNSILSPASDTANVVVVSAGQMSSIKNFGISDTLGQIKLSWSSLPNKGYFTGIEIRKSRQALEDYITLDTIPITDSVYFDNEIIPGTQYYYKIKALAYPFIYVEALPSAMGRINIENKSSKPFAPTAVVAVNEEQNIRLSWEDNPELDLYAYFVYRGTNANNMEQVSGIVQGNNWLDTSVTLSGLTTYAYAVKVMNRGQRMSESSAPVYIKPARLAEVPAIGGITGITKDDGYLLQWENIAENYTSLIGYILLRKASNEKEFFPVAQHIIEGASYTDSAALEPGIKYEYAVAAIDFNGSIGQLSPSVFYTANANKLKSPADFSAFLDNGKIKIKWPEEFNKPVNRKVNIYRKAAADKSFKLIGTSAGTEFIDDKTVSNVLYTYSVTYVLNNNESEKSNTQSVRAK